MKLSFTKMQGCANDYIYLDCRASGVPADIAALAQRLSARHFSVGADGIICICAPVTPGADGRMRIFNADGSVNAVGCPHLNTDVMERFGLVRNGTEQVVAGVHVYPADRFNPLDSTTGRLNKTENTYSIHWYSMSWLPKHAQLKTKLGRLVRRMVK